MCPFLATESGAWRAAFPVGEHRCTAVVPAVRIAPAKQRRLCLTAEHVDLRDLPRGPRAPGDRAGSPIGDARTAGTGRRRAIPVDHARAPRADPPGPAGPGHDAARRRPDRARRAARGRVPGGLLRPPRQRAGRVAPSPSVVDRGLEREPAPRRHGRPRPGRRRPRRPPSPSVSPSTVAHAAPRPPSRRRAPRLPPAGGTYKVKSGDTLSGIAAQFGTTVKALKDAQRAHARTSSTRARSSRSPDRAGARGPAAAPASAAGPPGRQRWQPRQ